MTPGELKSLVARLGLELVSDESALEYERAHLPPEAWPPTSWFENWAKGHNLFDVTCGTAPIELRWLELRRP